MSLNNLKSTKEFWIGIFLFGSMTILSILSPLLARFDPDDQINPSQNQYQSPTWKHWFGTDQFGRDVFSRILYGGRISLVIALCVVFLSIVIGGIYGIVSGYFGGLLDQILMRVVDLFLSFPVIFLAITCMALFGSGILMLIIVLTLTGWMDVARLVRAEVHSIKNRPFILKARSSGLGRAKIIWGHIIPNVLITIFAFSVIRLADIILIESALSFIGLGVSPPMASWGSILSDSRQVIGSAWWLMVFPGMAILFATMGLNLIGKGIYSKYKGADAKLT
jgi:peptide/nickel transport system permease protein